MFAPYHNQNRGDRPRIVGAFNEAELGNRFEFTERPEAEREVFAPGLRHTIFVGPYGAEEKRAALVLKAVAYIAVDEAEDGAPVLEKWRIKNHVLYPTDDSRRAMGVPA